jgi:hypothetical protein
MVRHPGVELTPNFSTVSPHLPTIPQIVDLMLFSEAYFIGGILNLVHPSIGTVMIGKELTQTWKR